MKLHILLLLVLMINVRFSSLHCMLGLALLASCGESTKQQQTKEAEALNTHQTQIKEQFVSANKKLMQKENDDMDAYCRSHKMPFVKTASGIRYFVYAPSAKGDSIKEGNIVHLKYKLYLLDGTLAYSSAVDGEKDFEIGKEDIESGIHKGLQLLKRGDKAYLMIPSPLAHGLLGDMNKIPPQMPIVYDVEVN